jgi:hypothetical protein
VAAREGGRPGEAREAGAGLVATAAETAAIVHLVTARAHLLQLRALNGSTHYHDTMRAVSDAARVLGVRPDELNDMAEAYTRDIEGEA